MSGQQKRFPTSYTDINATDYPLLPTPESSIPYNTGPEPLKKDHTAPTFNSDPPINVRPITMSNHTPLHANNDLNNNR